MMTLSPTIEAICAAARKRLYQCIDKRAEHAAGAISLETLNRALGQLRRDREAEKARKTQLGG